jgi:hypothetical protein
MFTRDDRLGQKDTAVLCTYEFGMHYCTSLLSFHNHVESHREETDLLKEICRACEISW